MSVTIIANLSSTSSRYWTWFSVFGTHEVALLQPDSAPNAKPVMFYSLDVASLDKGQRKRLIAYAARLFGMEEAVAMATIDRQGCPIPAEDVKIGQ